MFDYRIYWAISRSWLYAETLNFQLVESAKPRTKDKSKTPGCKLKPIQYKTLNDRKTKHFWKKCDLLWKMYNIVVWAFCFYGSFLMSSLHYAWNDHINRLSIKTNHISSCCVCLCLVNSQMFDQTWWIVYTFHDIFHLFYTFSHCKRLTNVRF